MKISYDKEVDALYIRLVEGPRQCHTVHLSENISLNFGLGETLVGIEILDASEAMLQLRGLNSLIVENLKVRAA